MTSWPAMSYCEAAAAGRAHGLAIAALAAARTETDAGIRAMQAREYVKWCRTYHTLKRRAIEMAAKESV